MSADPRCLVCAGSGRVHDGFAGRDEVCACTEVPRRDPSQPSGSGWIAESLGAILATAAKQQAEAEEHARACTDRPCKRCERYVCPCGEPVDGSERCAACGDRELHERLLAPTRKSVPAQFRWALDADAEKLRGRVQAPAELIARGLKNPPGTSLLLLGQTGAGKTSLAVAMLGAWVRADAKRTGALFAEAGWLSRARARHRLGEEAPLVTEALAAPLLVLDDLGSEREDRDGCITDIIYGRHNASLPTWVTCGISAPNIEAFAELLARRYDGGFVRRIIENGKRVTLGKVGA